MPKQDDLTPKEAAQKLRIRLDYLYSLIWARKLPARRVEGRWYIPAQSVEARLKARAARLKAQEARYV